MYLTSLQSSTIYFTSFDRIFVICILYISLYENNMFALLQVFEYGSAAAIVLGGVFPYIPQYLQIKKSENQEGFSLYVCLVLIIANTLRIIFW